MKKLKLLNELTHIKINADFAKIMIDDVQNEIFEEDSQTREYNLERCHSKNLMAIKIIDDVSEALLKIYDKIECEGVIA